MRATPGAAWLPSGKATMPSSVDTTEMGIEAAVAAVMAIVRRQPL